MYQGTKQMPSWVTWNMESSNTPKQRLGLAWERTNPRKMLTVHPHRAGCHRRDKVWADLLLEQETEEAGCD